MCDAPERIRAVIPRQGVFAPTPATESRLSSHPGYLQPNTAVDGAAAAAAAAAGPAAMFVVAFERAGATICGENLSKHG